MDYNQLRQSSNAKSRSVAVNHRALITRTLTKYPVDFALFRELLQNSADARASAVAIEFTTTNLPDNWFDILGEIDICQLRVSNDGAEFGASDWSRLSEIASGNPNTDKIGAFGVGFYSVFELTEKPVVHSGTQMMGFSYQGDQLNYAVMEGPFVKGTVIDMPYGKLQKLPDMRAFTAFLTQSLAIVPLKEVKVTLNGKPIFGFKKTAAHATQQHDMLKIDPKSRRGFFSLRGIDICEYVVAIEYLNATQVEQTNLKSVSGLFKFGRGMLSSMVKTQALNSEYTQTVLPLSLLTADMAVSLPRQFTGELKASLLKPPPKSASLSILYSKAGHDYSNAKPWAQYLFPQSYSDSKIFIGFPTKQTTWMKVHASVNNLIPSMERTAIDMSNAAVKDWNAELLQMLGKVSRFLYEHQSREYAKIENLDQQIAQAKAILNLLETSETSPNDIVNQCITAGFWDALKVILLPTTLGIRASTSARLTADIPQALLGSIPVFEKGVANDKFVAAAKEVAGLKNVTVRDLISILANKPLTQNELKEILEWSNKVKGSTIPTEQVGMILDNVSLNGIGDTPRPLRSFKTYQDQVIIPAGLPLPDHTLPASFIQSIVKSDLTIVDIQPLSLPSWAQFLAKGFYANLTPGEGETIMAGRILNTFSSGWRALRPTHRKAVVESLSNVCCIPTNLGLSRPSECYFERNRIFKDLPILADSLAASREFLQALGVRKSLDMAIILEAAHNPESPLKFSNSALIEYLLLNKADLQPSDWQVLKEGQMFRNAASGALCKVSTLYAPHPAVVQLGFPCLEWDHTWTENDASELLYTLGLMKVPDLTFVLGKGITSGKLTIALQFYFDFSKDYPDGAKTIAKFQLKAIPSSAGILRCDQVYSKQELRLFGLPVLEPALVSQASLLGVKERPSADDLVNGVIRKPPTSVADAEAMYTYLSGISFEISNNVSRIAARADIVPIDRACKLAAPVDVFFSSQDDGELNNLFNYVQTSIKTKPFLTSIGVKEAPTIIEIAKILANSPERVYQMSGSPTGYRAVLARMSAAWSQISRIKSLVSSLSRSPFAVVETFGTENAETRDELVRPGNALIVDDILIFQRFKLYVKAAPQDAAIESLYKNLGASTLTEAIDQKWQIGKALPQSIIDDKAIENFRDRLQIFLQSTSKKKKCSKNDLNKLSFESVTMIERKESLPGAPLVVTKTTACHSPRRAWGVCITPNFDVFDLAEVLTKLILIRPDPESVMVMEMLLTYDLEALSRKGYNVSRLLKKEEPVAKAAQFTNANEAEDVPMSDNGGSKEPMRPHSPYRDDPSKRPPSEPQPQGMPGAWPRKTPNPSKAKDTPTRQPAPVEQQQQQQQRKQQRLPQEPRNNQQIASTKTDSQDESLRSKVLKQINSVASLSKNDGWNPFNNPGSRNRDVEPKRPEDLINMDSLRMGIDRSRPHTRAELTAPQHMDAHVPLGHGLDEKQCTARVHDIELRGNLLNGMPLFVAKNQKRDLNQEELQAGQSLSELLILCAQMYSVSVDCISVFSDNPSTIAFNYNGSLFFNLKAHEILAGQGIQVCFDYWYLTFAHELAHNLEHDHNAQHGHWTQLYVLGSLPNYRAQLLQQQHQ